MIRNKIVDLDLTFDENEHDITVENDDANLNDEEETVKY